MTKDAQQLAAALDEHFRVWKVGPGGIVIEIDTKDADTPALVWDSMRRKYSNTYECAVSEGGLEEAPEPFFTAQMNWLEEFRPQVDRAFEIARRDLPQYK